MVDTMTSPAPTIGAYLLKGRYRLQRIIDKGGYGIVHLAEDTSNGQPVAVKEMQSGFHFSEWEERMRMAQREGAMLAAVQHPGIPHLIDQFSCGGRWYLVMEFIDGVTLEEYLKCHKRPFPIDEALWVGLKLCDILEYLHTLQPPIVFRDLKPSNILLTHDQRLFLVDFGLALRYVPGNTTLQSSYGTVGYAPPEMYLDDHGHSRFSPQSDIYSLGAILHQLLTGIDPHRQQRFHFAPLPKKQYPESIGTLIGSMVSFEEDARPVSIAEVRRAIESVAL